MEDFFVIGSEDPSFLTSTMITSLPQCKGIVLLNGDRIYSRVLPFAHVNKWDEIPLVSLGSFLLYASRNPGVALVSCYDFPGGRHYVKKLQQAARNKFKLYDYYNFCLEYNVPMMFVPAQDERKIILDARKEWAEFRNRLTDGFSRLSLDCYLEACEKMDTSLLLPAYVGFENMFFNRISRKLSVVPDSSEIYVDIGALDGDTVALFVDCARDYREIHAFEPLKHLYEDLKKKKFYLDRFHAYNLAVSDAAGEIDFLPVQQRVADSYIPDNAVVDKVPCARLDDVIGDVTLLKIETEGHEAKVIEGAANLIRKCNPEMIVQAYHFPLDPLRIIEAVNKAHSYKHISLRFYTVGMHIFSLLFSDRAPFE